MARSVRVLLVAAVAVVAGVDGAPRALGCGSNGYSYAGLGSPDPGFGIAATITSVADFDVRHGHVAGWVGVGGAGEGPGGSNEWLQVGLQRSFSVPTGSEVYYEVALPHRYPAYHRLAVDLPAGKAVRVAVLEMRRRPNWWRVWLNGSAASRPIRLPGSDDRWEPIATAESWDGGTGGACNGFLYRFHHVQVAHRAGGGWRPLVGGNPIRSSPTRIRRSRMGAAFLAAEGAAALKLLSSLEP
jgi:hypothetical protein